MLQLYASRSPAFNQDWRNDVEGVKVRRAEEDEWDKSKTHIDDKHMSHSLGLDCQLYRRLSAIQTYV